MTNVSHASLVDTNILVYWHDPRDRRKQELAKNALRQLIAAERAAVSVQCLSEFYRTTTQRLPEPLDPASAIDQIGRLIRTSSVLDLTPTVVLEACRASAQHQLSIWDALVWATAKVNGIPHLLTEDAEHGRFLEGVTYLDPFDERFELAPLLA